MTVTERTVPLPGLVDVRRDRGMTQADVASAAGCSRQTVVRAETGSPSGSCSMETVWRISRALGVSVERLGGASLMEVSARYREDVARMLLEYRAVPLQRRPKRKEMPLCD